MKLRLDTAADPKPVNLSNLGIASPCPADWEKMVGDERVRHCAECNLNVYNLSAMTELQVQKLIQDSRGKRLCARFIAAQTARFLRRIAHGACVR